MNLDCKKSSLVPVVTYLLGPIWSDLIFSNSSALLFNICPMDLGQKTDSIGFEDCISIKLDLPKTRIKNCLHNR